MQGLLNDASLIRKYTLTAQGRQATVALIGPRQVGKTTLALEVSEHIPALYLDLEAVSLHALAAELSQKKAR